MNAIALLKKQHREVEELFERCWQVEGDLDELGELCRMIENALATHATIEEQIFYPLCKDIDEDLIRESLEEHLAVKRVIADLLATDVDDPQFRARLKLLEEQVQHHVEEEEKELFPQVQKKLNVRRLQKVGREMEMMAERLEREEPREQVPSETEAPAPL